MFCTKILRDFSYFGKTKIGAEVLANARRDMQTIDSNPNPILRYMAKKRNIDQLQIDVEGRIADELHWSFRHVMKVMTALMTTPVLVGLLSGTLQPTHFFLVRSGAVQEEKYISMWKLANPWIVAAGQLLLFAIYYDVTIYLRMPLFAHVLAPIYRKLGLLKPQALGAVSIKELKSKGLLQSKGKPLGRQIATPSQISTAKR